ncbi:MAG: NRDE family protein [Haloferacaceae archaeon]
MCTLVLAWRVFADAPVAVAANRDEATDRPAEPPSRRGGGADPAFVAPRDAEAGGTWTGYNEHGLYVGLTNRWVGEGADLTGGRSRGLLVEDALRERSAEAAARLVEGAVARHEYEGFAAVLADDRAAFLIEWDGRLRVRGLDPGVHVIVNVGAALGGGGAARDRFAVPPGRRAAGERQADGARRLRAALAPEPGETSAAWLDRAADALADHEYGVCVHGDGFGTRSSSLIALGDEPVYRFADGPPCRTSYARVDEQV